MWSTISSGSKSSGLAREEANLLGEVSDGGERLCQDKIFFTEDGDRVLPWRQKLELAVFLTFIEFLWEAVGVPINVIEGAVTKRDWSNRGQWSTALLGNSTYVIKR